MTDLFTPARFGAIELANRIVMSSLTRNRAGAGNVPTPLVAEYYRQRASAGLILTEASPICPEGHGYPRTPGIHSEAQIAGWQRRDRCRACAPAGKSPCSFGTSAASRIRICSPAGSCPSRRRRSAGRADVHRAGHEGLRHPARARRRMRFPGWWPRMRKRRRMRWQAGFDGVEVHAGNGYLIDQFLRSSTNQRTDAYGGSKEKRARLLLEVLDAVAGAIGNDRVGLRLSPVTPFNDIRDDAPQDTFDYVVTQLNPRRLAFLDILQGTGGAPREQWEPFDYDRLRELYEGNLILNNGYDFASGQAATWRGARPMLIAFGRLLLANPDLVERFRRGAPLNQPDYDRLYVGEEKGYTDYPALTG